MTRLDIELIKEDDIIEIKGETLKYVSRGGLKLEKALKEFNINLTNKIMLDIGSSTGGFTDCALQNNAKEDVCVIKPQFECGKEVADKYKGIILNKEIHKNIIEKIIDSFNEINYYINGLTFSPVKGGNGNIEYLAYFAKTKVNNLININNLVDETFSKLK